MKILLAGEGGQGVQVVGQLLAHATYLENRQSLYIPNFGVEQRGGVSLAFVVAEKEVAYPKFKTADYVIVFCDRAIPRVKTYIGQKTKTIISPTVTAKLLPKAIKVSPGQFSPKVYNIIVLGKILQQTKMVKIETIKKAMDERFAGQFQKHPEIKKMDLDALEFGLKN